MKPHISRGGRRVFTRKADFVMRNDMPYGIWTCEDGREVLFNRFYEPIWERRPGEAATQADPRERVRFVKQAWLYDDGTSKPDRKNRGNALLKSWGLPEVVLTGRKAMPAVPDDVTKPVYFKNTEWAVTAFGLELIARYGDFPHAREPYRVAARQIAEIGEDDLYAHPVYVAASRPWLDPDALMEAFAEALKLFRPRSYRGKTETKIRESRTASEVSAIMIGHRRELESVSAAAEQAA